MQQPQLSSAEVITQSLMDLAYKVTQCPRKDRYFGQLNAHHNKGPEGFSSAHQEHQNTWKQNVKQQKLCNSTHQQQRQHSEQTYMCLQLARSIDTCLF